MLTPRQSRPGPSPDWSLASGGLVSPVSVTSIQTIVPTQEAGVLSLQDTDIGDAKCQVSPNVRRSNMKFTFVTLPRVRRYNYNIQVGHRICYIRHLRHSSGL